MEKIFMPEVSADQRKLILEQNADSVEQTTYLKPLTEDEILGKKDILTDNSIRLFDIEEDKKEAMKVYKDKIDPLKKENNLLLSEIRTGQAKVAGILYHMANHDEGYMETYDENGELIQSRKLRPDEKQKTILYSVGKTGTN